MAEQRYLVEEAQLGSAEDSVGYPVDVESVPEAEEGSAAEEVALVRAAEELELVVGEEESEREEAAEEARLALASRYSQDLSTERILHYSLRGCDTSRQCLAQHSNP